jgi:hypothetical protein
VNQTVACNQVGRQHDRLVTTQHGKPGHKTRRHCHSNCPYID